MRLPIAQAVLLAIFATRTNALLVAPSSRCAVQCGNVLSATSGGDLTCSDSTYGSAVIGQTFQNCISCELNSTYADHATGQTDLQWLLYNLRYTVSWCIFGFPNNTEISTTPCTTSFACGALKNSVEYESLMTNSTAYGYCSNWESGFVQSCTTCLRQLGNEDYLANFVVALAAGCQQMPPSGSQIALDGPLFQSTLVNITTPVSSSAAVYTPPPPNTLTLGAKVGIAIAGLVALFVITGTFIICRGKQRRRAYLRKLADKTYSGPDNPAWKEYNSPESETGRAFMAPDNQRWQGGNDDSPMSAKPENQTFSPYVSQYTSPVSPAIKGERVFPAVPIPAPYEGPGRRQSKTSIRGAVDDAGIEMSQISRSNSIGVVAPIIKAPTPTHAVPDAPAGLGMAK